MINNSDFFPTPLEITKKMVEKLGSVWEWSRKIEYILEPSAGKGDLIENFFEIYDNELGKWQKAQNIFTVDVIEIEPILIDTLRGKKYNVVANDFLEFNPVRYYDLILANFPFSNGCKHLLKAIEIQERIGGKILCIVNAETIKNTYSNDRKYLSDKLREYNADIEFVKDGFVNAERSTGVEIAIIYLDIPMKNKESMFEREFKRDNPDIDFKNFNAVTTKMNKLQQLVFEYDLVIKSVTKLFEEEMRIKSLLKGFNIEANISICNNLARPEKITINEFIEDTNQKYWDKFISETSFENKLPSKLRDNFRSNMQKQKNISFNMDNVMYFYEELIKSIPKSYEETIADLFDKVTRKYNYTDNEWNKNIWGYNGWKTNDAYSIKKKVIIPCYLSNSYYRYNIPSELIDLNIAFNNITGIDASKDFEYNSEIINSIRDNKKKIETSHFILDSYKKGTLHITFKDKKAVATFNYLAAKGKAWLPEGMEDKNYNDMTEDEKEIVKVLGFEPIEYQTYIGKQKDYLRLL